MSRTARAKAAPRPIGRGAHPDELGVDEGEEVLGFRVGVPAQEVAHARVAGEFELCVLAHIPVRAARGASALQLVTADGEAVLLHRHTPTSPIAKVGFRREGPCWTVKGTGAAKDELNKM